MIRRREYLETIGWLTSMGVASIIVWLVSDRDFAMLGLGFDATWQQMVSLALATTFSALLFKQVLGVSRDRDPAVQAAARKALEPVREFMPTTRHEARLFRGVSISAGVGEEIYYRGFLLWYLTQSMSLLWAIAATSALFGLAHVMHGVQATLRSTAMGVLLAGLYVFSGTLWASMLLHTAVDLSSGETATVAFSDSSTVAV